MAINVCSLMLECVALKSSLHWLIDDADAAAAADDAAADDDGDVL